MIELKPLTETDLNTVKVIYDYYIKNTTVTFHTEPISISELKEFIYINHPRYLSFGVWMDNIMIGYSYFGAYKKRQAYERTAEITFYLGCDNVHHGIGQLVIAFMEMKAPSVGIYNLLAVVTASNVSSIRILERNGYAKCAHLKNMGEKFQELLDIVVFQKELPRG